MENDINDVLATKRAWRNAEAIERRKSQRRIKDGSPEDRKDLADVLRAGRKAERLPWPSYNWRPWWEHLLRKMGLLMVMMVICGCAQAYTASWYSQTDAYIKPLTASGEIFNDRALTAASWAYPLGTLVRVTNRATGASVVVRINDRGPAKRLYRKGRIIDLTKTAFARIAPISAGIIHIKVEVISGF